MYDLSVEYGTLTVIPRKLSLSTESRSKTYDGTPLTSSKISLVSGNLILGDSIVALGESSITEVGSISNEIPYYIASSSGDDVTKHYDIKHTYGKLNIIPKALNIKTSGTSKTYDGKGILLDDWNFIGGTNIGNGEKISLVFHEFTEVGTHKNIPDVLITDESGRDITDRYKITFSAESITINKKYLAISTGSASKVYDGTPISKKTLSIVSGSLLSGHYIKNQIFTEAVDAGITKNVADIIIFDSEGNEVTGCYNIVCKPGELTVHPKNITISTGTARKKFDDTPLSSNDYRLVGDSLCSGHTIDFIGSSITNPGTMQNFPTRLVIYDQSAGQRKDVTNNYVITYRYGTLTVTN